MLKGPTLSLSTQPETQPKGEMTDSIPVLSIILVKNEGIPQLMAMSMGKETCMNIYHVVGILLVAP